MTRVAVATSSQLAADAASEVSRSGGNAVDCALAASLVTMNTQPGLCKVSCVREAVVSGTNDDCVVRLHLRLTGSGATFALYAVVLGFNAARPRF